MKKYRRILALALLLVLFLGGIGIIQNALDQTEFEDESVVKVEEKTSSEEKAETVEILKSPVDDSIGIVRYFYNKDDDASKQEQSLILFENVYRPNLGVDYANGNKSFDVTASISGTVTKKTNDPVLGWIVTVSNDSGIATTYQSLSEVSVELNATVKQGDKIGVSGENIYESDLKNHLHFILEKDDVVLNPETYIGKEISAIK
ncbi:MAG: M23 family metallopeptidase [Bacilli bacterium]|nr:M23 family metallopeptidase [Bacilli bacterium]